VSAELHVAPIAINEVVSMYLDGYIEYSDSNCHHSNSLTKLRLLLTSAEIHEYPEFIALYSWIFFKPSKRKRFLNQVA